MRKITKLKILLFFQVINIQQDITLNKYQNRAILFFNYCVINIKKLFFFHSN